MKCNRLVLVRDNYFYHYRAQAITAYIDFVGKHQWNSELLKEDLSGISLQQRAMTSLTLAEY